MVPRVVTTIGEKVHSIFLAHVGVFLNFGLFGIVDGNSLFDDKSGYLLFTAGVISTSEGDLYFMFLAEVIDVFLIKRHIRFVSGVDNGDVDDGGFGDSVDLEIWT